MKSDWWLVSSFKAQPTRRRLAVDTGDGKVHVYETEDHRISGVQQHESSRRRELLARQFVGLGLDTCSL